MRTFDSRTNSGTIEIGAGASFVAQTGSLPLTASSTLSVEIAALDSFGFVDVADTATLAGTLAINLVGNYEPDVGDTFVVMEFTSSSGGFASVTGLTIAGGKQFQVNVNADNLTLEVVAQQGGSPARGTALRPPERREGGSAGGRRPGCRTRRWPDRRARRTADNEPGSRSCRRRACRPRRRRVAAPGRARCARGGALQAGLAHLAAVRIEPVVEGVDIDAARQLDVVASRLLDRERLAHQVVERLGECRHRERRDSQRSCDHERAWRSHGLGVHALVSRVKNTRARDHDAPRALGPGSARRLARRTAPRVPLGDRS